MLLQRIGRTRNEHLSEAPAMKTRSPGGFTIVELLVVITIIGILMALLFPALNSAREGARQRQCISNMRQVVLAVQAATSAKGGKFPKHLALDPSGAQNWPWVARVLTELGRADVYDAITLAPAIAGRSERIDVLICPSDPPVNVADLQINYAANAGIDGLDDPAGSGGANCGVFQQTVDVSLPFKDGVSTTLMLAENVDATFWNAQSTAAADVYQTAIIWQASEPAGYGLNKGKAGAASMNLARPSSNHSGGFVATFCDASTKFLNDAIGYEVYKKIMTPNGSLVVPAQALLSEQELTK
jgi:prepilin-type N-terminal cleavage/methylation domain-containing protein